LKKNYFSSHRLPKQQSTSFWSQGILGVNITFKVYHEDLFKVEHIFYRSDKNTFVHLR
jgi:hypothetical protein